MDNMSDSIFFPELSNLGDMWLYFNILLSHLGPSVRRVKTVTIAANGQSVETKLLEMRDLFEHGPKVLLVRDPGQTLVHNWKRARDYPHPYFPTLVLWQDQPKRRICYQFDGAWKKEVKNPPPTDEATLSSWLHNFEFVRLGSHLTLQECVHIASESELFLGVDSGMAHVCESVGIPRFLVQYNNWDMAPFTLAGSYTLCRGTDDAKQKVEHRLKLRGLL